MTEKWRDGEGKLVDPPNSMLVDLWIPKHEVEAELRYLKGSISMARADERDRLIKELRHMVDNPWSTPEEQRAVRAMCNRIRVHGNDEVIDTHMIQPEAKPMTLGQLVDAINQLVREGKPLA